MAEGLNRAILVGNLGMDPELKFTKGGQAVLRIRLATTDSYLCKTGERQASHPQRLARGRRNGHRRIVQRGILVERDRAPTGPEVSLNGSPTLSPTTAGGSGTTPAFSSDIPGGRGSGGSGSCGAGGAG